MPNHVTNLLIAPVFVLDAIKGPEEMVDFNTQIPMPESLKKAVSEGTATGLGELLAGKIDIRAANNRGDMQSLISSLSLGNVMRTIERGAISQFHTEESFENFLLILRNWRDYGYGTWYDWAPDKWGTKWNAYDCAAVEGGVKFETAWNAPHPVIEVLASKFPSATFEHKWADEDIGNNLGHRRYSNGAFENIPITDPVDFALALNGDTERECYRISPGTGLWEYFDEEEDQ